MSERKRNARPSADGGVATVDCSALVAAIRETLSKQQAGKASILSEQASALAEVRTAKAAELDALKAQSGARALDGAATYTAHLQAIAAAEAELSHFTALQEHVAGALASAREDEADDDVRAVLKRSLALVEKAASDAATYEKHARLAAAALASHDAAFDAMRDIEYALRGPVRDGRRTEEWRRAMESECVATLSALASRLHVFGDGVELRESVQLPSSLQLEPYWGNVFGVVRETAEERNARLFAAPDDSKRREMGVYDAAGRKLNHHAQYDPDFHPNSVIEREDGL